MIIDFDPAKSAKNEIDRGLPFTQVEDFDWDSGLFAEDLRNAYPERRFEAIGPIADRLFVLVFTPIAGGVRVISLRKANPREVRRYEQAQDK